MASRSGWIDAAAETAGDEKPARGTMMQMRWRRMGSVACLLASLVLASGARAHEVRERHERFVDGERENPDRAWVLVHEQKDSASGSGDESDFHEARRLRSRYRGTFLWLRDGDARWVTRDPDLLKRTR